jgi:hypothetical protein
LVKIGILTSSNNVFSQKRSIVRDFQEKKSISGFVVKV